MLNNSKFWINVLTQSNLYNYLTSGANPVSSMYHRGQYKSLQVKTHCLFRTYYNNKEFLEIKIINETYSIIFTMDKAPKLFYPSQLKIPESFDIYTDADFKNLKTEVINEKRPMAEEEIVLFLMEFT